MRIEKAAMKAEVLTGVQHRRDSQIVECPGKVPSSRRSPGMVSAEFFSALYASVHDEKSLEKNHLPCRPRGLTPVQPQRDSQIDDSPGKVSQFPSLRRSLEGVPFFCSALWYQ